MGFGYAGTFLIIFLTHPGVVIPSVSSITSKIPMDLVPPQYEAMIPKEGFPPVLSGLWQVLCAWVLTLPGGRSVAVAWTMFILYSFFLFLYIYFGGLGVRLTAGV